MSAKCGVCGDRTTRLGDGTLVIRHLEDCPERPVSADTEATKADSEYGDEMTRLLHSTDDAMVWAVEWCKVARRLSGEGRSLIDEGWMVGWFANAMETAKRIDRERRAAVVETPTGEEPK